MKTSKSVIIGLAVMLIVVIGYALYLYQGPIKRISNENEKLVAEIDQLKTTSEDLNAVYKARLDEKTHLAEELERKTAELGGMVSRIEKERETLETDLRGTIKSLENQLAQRERELQTSSTEEEELRSTIALLRSSVETLNQESEDLGRLVLDSKNQLEGLHKELSTKDKEIASATEENQAMRKRMDLVEGERDQLKQANLELENQLTEYRSRFQTVSDELVARDRIIADIEKTHQSFLSQINKQEKEKEELQRLKNALKNQVGMSQSQIEALSMEAETKEEQLKSMEKALQELTKRFELQIREKEIEIKALENKLSIRLLDKILFASGSADITSSGQRVLESLAIELKEMDRFEIEVAGHTDNKPLGPKVKEVYYDNLGLSVARAAAVVRTLREIGVSPDNLSAVGYSMYRPVASNETKEGRQQNRRVEIILAPLR